MLKSLFGTDGIRGQWESKITPELAFEIGKAVSVVFKRENQNSTIVVGKDTRLSSQTLELALVSGMIAGGANVVNLGVVPTAVVPFSINEYKANGAVMITASHNPASHNGFKFFNGNGLRISQTQEKRIEHIIANCQDYPVAKFNQLGKVINSKLSVKKYIAQIRKELPKNCKTKILIDCANGAACSVIKKIFEGYDVKYVANKPNGININENCGATCPNNLTDEMKSGKFDIGFAFDGDADRLKVVLKNGKDVSGEEIIYNLVKHNKLKSVVTTKMSNMALALEFEKENISCFVVDIGESAVIEGLLKNNCVFGGENNGHYLLLSKGPSSDGILACAQILSIFQKNKKLSVPFKPFAHFETSIKVLNKNEVIASKQLNEKIEICESLLAESGRILVRASGTEEVVRILVEGENKTLVEEIGKTLKNCIENCK